MAERARVEETLRHAQRIEAIGRLTGGIAHDFNNLLMVISGGLDILQRHADPARRQRLMDGMRQATQRGAALTRKLLAFSRRQPLKPEVVDLSRHIGAMRELLDRSLGGDAVVELDFANAIWPVEVDAGELELAIINLAVNARDAMPKGGKIIIRGENLPNFSDDELTGDYVRLSVTDTGTGMSPEVLAHVFEPYFTTKETGKGSGLGLTQVYGFAVQSRGAVRINSEVGRGTAIVLYLPRSDEAPTLNQRNLDRPDVQRPLAQDAGRVLLVEDDDEVAALTSDMLDQLGYKVTRASSAAAALGALANERSIDIVFSDIMMPGGMNGVHLAQEIRRSRPNLPLLLTSGYAEAAANAAKAAGLRILPKPYGIEQLSAALHAALSDSDAVACMRN